jgi:hypothetical protein
LDHDGDGGTQIALGVDVPQEVDRVAGSREVGIDGAAAGAVGRACPAGRVEAERPEDRFRAVELVPSWAWLIWVKYGWS